MIDRWFREWVAIQHGDHDDCEVSALLEHGNPSIPQLYEAMNETEGTDWIESWHIYLEDRIKMIGGYENE